MFRTLIMAPLAALMIAVAPAQAGKVVNGNFEAGNTGFITEYTFKSDGKVCNAANYAIGSVASDASCFGDWSSFHDHTSGVGLMMIVNGATRDTADTIVWSETVTVRPQSDYRLTFWGRAAQAFDSGESIPLQVYFDGMPMGDPLALPPADDGVWHKGTARWHSGSARHVTISIVDKDIANEGNDFALDDIKLKLTK